MLTYFIWNSQHGPFASSPPVVDLCQGDHADMRFTLQAATHRCSVDFAPRLFWFWPWGALSGSGDPRARPAFVSFECLLTFRLQMLQAHPVYFQFQS